MLRARAAGETCRRPPTSSAADGLPYGPLVDRLGAATTGQRPRQGERPVGVGDRVRVERQRHHADLVQLPPFGDAGVPVDVVGAEPDGHGVEVLLADLAVHLGRELVLKIEVERRE
jgi:hypothetical protein